MTDKINEEALFNDERQIELIKETEKRHEHFLNICRKVDTETEKETHKLKNEDYQSLFEEDRNRYPHENPVIYLRNKNLRTDFD